MCVCVCVYVCEFTSKLLCAVLYVQAVDADHHQDVMYQSINSVSSAAGNTCLKRGPKAKRG